MTLPLPALIVEPIVRAALLEDLGRQGDVTSRAVLPPGAVCTASMKARAAGVVSGVSVAALAFRLVDPGLELTVLRPDGSSCAAGEAVLTVSGNAVSVLTGERVALNFAARLSGIATVTAAHVAQTRGTGARVACSRKTTPGLRALEKQAVLHGGGVNHRYDLSDAMLIKDNHIAVGGGVAQVLRAARARASHMMRIEIEVDSLAQLEDVLTTGGADAVLLDNMDSATLREAVAMVGGRLITEASGGMTLARIAEVAATGVDYISCGGLTHSAPALDLGLDI
ncbi:nicotinate-nucleotide pyrophosphorylase [carboxylating] [Rhodovulum imhoffii]|uniref:Probable nicotinate-nucleotide pyrophosphorylase [carboxylating] n=1 Tax=Rhodovulum imhoffii TaxID=365340 RepID=A0A2T5BWL9_9RHOB|nr:carboxylating nicotinate-nucleotide diphosphorylase [Rhodovulum imhoffii]MBK5933282.1 nicotinate-nucleotide diphosphorylase (carboxylating) [Rhodovulum imhoffii]PTN04041.1 nicotinate-nucleotide pyrophosphorylase [carboxylating] [Rhodovulum imhoffii]